MKENIEQLIGAELRERGWRLAVAESCTGGLIGHRITNNSGSSTYYLGSITAYAYRAKVRLLGVSWNTLEDHGAVSEEAVEEMALGVRHALAADIGLSVSGIAGPTGGTPDKPVGYAWIGLSTPTGIWTLQHNAGGDRIENKQEVAQIALEFLYQFLT
ncbi:MAG: nicotinamide-nucleotide amidohydrolase family protein, partial [Anaerolineales bacterium]|nr:nicotinamide-nucleotide amidohydrolase family protein [Anaerolineales bacterium]